MTLNYETEIPVETLASVFGEMDPEKTAHRVIVEALEKIGCPFEAQVNLLLTDDDAIHEMNRQFRGIDRATDVLSFPMLSFETPGDFSFLDEEGSMDADCFDPGSGELLLGDIVVSVDHCIAQANAYAHSITREYAFLIAHSMLHLCGFDHLDAAQEKEMFSRQELILQELGITR